MLWHYYHGDTTQYYGTLAFYATVEGSPTTVAYLWLTGRPDGKCDAEMLVASGARTRNTYCDRATAMLAHGVPGALDICEACGATLHEHAHVDQHSATDATMYARLSSVNLDAENVYTRHLARFC